MKHMMDDINGHYKSLLLFPDYSSTGLWCECGISISDPLEKTNIPYELIELVDCWNLLWEHMSMYNKSINVEIVEKKIISVGRILEERISEYVPCTLIEESCKLNIREWE